MPVDKKIILELLSNQKKSIKYHVFMALVVILLGLTVIGVSFAISDNLSDNVKLILEVGGGFISTVSALSINKVIIRLNRVNTLRLFALNFDNFSTDDLRKVEEYFWEAVR